MACQENNSKRRVKLDGRPVWPYEQWSDEYMQLKWKDDMDEEVLFEEESSNTVTTKKGKQSETPLDTADNLEPDHWTDALDVDVPKSCPIYTLLNTVHFPDASQTPEAEEIRTEIVQMMKNTLEELAAKYKLFEKSYILPVGSMEENTKIKKADEFDFAIILPSLAEKGIYSFLLRKDSMYSDPDVKRLATDICDGDIEELVLNFQSILKLLWSSTMSLNIAPGWEILDTGCYQDDVSIAGTFHIKRESDNSIVDLDVCFWIPLDSEMLSSAPDEIEQRDYLLTHSLDDNGLVYAILPRDENISLNLNCVRFAMSRLEKQTFHQYGPENGRLKCYRLCKCVVAALVPKFKKREKCSFCFESLVSSFCVKNIVLYMTAYHKDDALWTNDQLPNRICEVFSILTFCVKVNASEISAFFSPYEIAIDRFSQFDPGRSSLTDSYHEFMYAKDKICVIPDLAPLINNMEDTASKQLMSEYSKFLTSSKWHVPEVLCRLDELLCGLREEDPTEREKLANEPGWNTFGLELPKIEGFIPSVDTKL